MRKDITDKQVCEAVRDCTGSPSPLFADSLLAQRTGGCMKVCQRAMERALERDLIDYGVSLRTAWLTDKGEELLK